MNASKVRNISRRALVPLVSLGLLGGFAGTANAASGAPFGNGFDVARGVDGGVAVKGWAIDPDTSAPVTVRVSIDGAVQSLTANTPRPDVESVFPGYGPNHGFEATLSAQPGTRSVCVTFVNVGAGSNKDAGCRSVIVPSSGSTTTQVSTTSSKPGAGTAGVPAGTSLRVHNGDLRITQPGTVIDGWDIRGYVEIQADNVTIKRSMIRGGAAATSNRALVEAWWQYKNFVIEDSTLKASSYSLHIDGISGSNFTARRLNISGVVDPVKVIGSNVTVTDSWLHDTIHSDNDPNQSDGRTHDDNVQIVGGSNIVLRGNVMTDSHNAAIMISQGYAPTTSVRIENNWLGNGVCTINVSNSGAGGAGKPIQGLQITGNRFAPGTEGTRCPMRLPSGTPIQLTANVWDNTNTTATPQWF